MEKKKLENALTVKQPSEMTRKEVFIENLSIYTDVKRAALEAEYSESYADKLKYSLPKNERLIAAIQRRYGADAATLRLPALNKIRDCVYEIVLADPTQEPKYRHVFKTDMQMSGVLSPDSGPRQTFVHIDKVQQLMAMVSEARKEGRQIAADDIISIDGNED